MKTADTVFELVRPTVENMGFELDEVEFQKEQGNWVLTLYIDKEGGVNIDDCENVSRAVDPILDEADPIEQHYYLSVSSIGIDRPLKKEKDYRRNMGNELIVKLYAPKDGKKELRGVLTAFTEEELTIETQAGPVTVLKKDAALVRPYISFD